MHLARERYPLLVMCVPGMDPYAGPPAMALGGIMGFLIEGYSRVGGGVFAIGLILALVGMILTIAPELVRNDALALALSWIAVAMTIIGVLMMVTAVVMT